MHALTKRAVSALEPNHSPSYNNNVDSSNTDKHMFNVHRPRFDHKLYFCSAAIRMRLGTPADKRRRSSSVFIIDRDMD